MAGNNSPSYQYILVWEYTSLCLLTSKLNMHFKVDRGNMTYCNQGADSTVWLNMRGLSSFIVPFQSAAARLWQTILRALTVDTCIWPLT
jgi:hypothetical protein